MSEPSGIGRQRIQFAVFFLVVIVIGALFFYQPWNNNDTSTGQNTTQNQTSENNTETSVETTSTGNGSTESTVDIITTPASLGNADAPVLIEEYSDFQCSICRRYVTTLKDEVNATFVETGMVQVKLYHYIKYGEESILAAQAAECANEQGKFWEYHRTLYDNQRGINRGTFTNESLMGFAEQLELDTAAFETCLTSDKYREKIENDTAMGKERGVRSTPTFVINGEVIGNITSIDMFRQLIEKTTNE